jgi:thymidylate kinase
MARKTVLLSGACGAGKTSAMRLIRRHLLPILGETAVIDVDHVYMMVDPDYSIPFPEAETYWSLARRQCALLAKTYLCSGFGAAVIGGNSIYQKDRLNEMLEMLLEVSEVYHLTLDPDPEVIKRRILARSSPEDGMKTPEWIDAHVCYMREHYEPWTACIDNSSLSPDETVQAIHRAILENRGRLKQLFSL